MREHDLQPRRRHRYVATTDSDHKQPIYPNRARDLTIDRPNQLWVADITYVAIAEGFAYVAVILDVWSRRAVGYAIGRSIDVRLTLAAFNAAIEREPAARLHPPYRSRFAIRCSGLSGSPASPWSCRSMGRRGNPFDNAKAESFMKTLKVEAVYPFAKQRELLEKAIQEDPSDGDVLIALYRLPDPSAEQRQKTLELIAAAIQLSRNQIDEEPDHWTAYNQLAWLVANTEGDFDEAVRLSEKSVELIRAQLARDVQAQGEIKSLEWGELLGGHLDTLAHCYAAKGDYEAAVKTQTEANRLLPYSLTISNKLTFFRGKLPKTEKKDSP